MSTWRLRAHWICPGTSPPIENGAIEVERGRIVRVSSGASITARAEDLGDAIVLPGLVNAHTHLMLSGMRGRIAHQGSFTRWLRGLVATHPRLGGSDAVTGALQEGLRESIAAGVTTVADIGDGEEPADAWSDARINVAGFLEVLGIGPRRAGGHPKALPAVRELFRHKYAQIRPVRLPREAVPDGGLFVAGISPHAPYSTDASVYREAVDLARDELLLICSHLAETPEEERFLRDGTGPFRELLEEFGLWDGSFEPPGCSPVAFAARVGLLDCRPLLAHCNYVSDDDLGLLAASGASVAFCPRTHAFFAHEPHRWRDMLAAGINVCIGTDSLASSETLSVLDDLRHLARACGDAPHDLLLRMGTLNGAAALRMERRTGSLEEGKLADLAVVPLCSPKADPLEDLLCGSALPVATYAAGCRLNPRPGQ